MNKVKKATTFSSDGQGLASGRRCVDDNLWEKGSEATETGKCGSDGAGHTVPQVSKLFFLFSWKLEYLMRRKSVEWPDLKKMPTLSSDFKVSH